MTDVSVDELEGLAAPIGPTAGIADETASRTLSGGNGTFSRPTIQYRTLADTPGDTGGSKRRSDRDATISQGEWVNGYR